MSMGLQSNACCPYKKRKGHIETQTQGQGCLMMEAETGEMQPKTEEDQGDTPGSILPWRSSGEGDPTHTLTEDFRFWHRVYGTLFPREPRAQTLVQHISAHSMGPGGRGGGVLLLPC